MDFLTPECCDTSRLVDKQNKISIYVRQDNNQKQPNWFVYIYKASALVKSFNGCYSADGACKIANDFAIDATRIFGSKWIKLPTMNPIWKNYNDPADYDDLREALKRRHSEKQD